MAPIMFYLERSEEEGGEEPPLEESDDHLGLGLGAEAGLLYDVLPAVNVVSPAEPTPAPVSIGKISSATAARLAREPSVQSDVTSHTGSHCSSVESYLESRRPDPEEVLLSLGFGGSAGGAGSVDTEVSRIPRRFLQPSKVKGVEIDGFLRYQQDLIETFESGFCGYRGLTGPSHTVPSVIVAKIMEKLREHERENIPPSSVASAPAIGITTPSTPVSSAAGKFSKAARRVLTRTAVLGALPLARQQQQQSVLTPDNRRFLDNQGSKSPEVPRKRMIIGHRSYTFGCDGDLIELEPSKDPITPITQPIIFPPKPKPLVHKDSVLSNATSLSLTSVDSDSDTDDHSSSFGLQHRRNLSTSPPKPLQFSTPNLSEDSEVPHLQRIYLPFSPVSKRMSSTSLSSWESEAISPINSLPDMRSGMRHLSTDEPLSEQEEHEDAGLKMISKRSNRFHSTPDSPLLTSWPMRYESIDEDAEMRSDQSLSLLSTSTSELSHDTQSKSSDGQNPYYGKSIEQHMELTESCLAESEQLPTESNSTRELNGDEYEHQNEEIEQSGETKSDKSHEQQVQIQKHVISLLQLRRSSLKRQQRVLDDEEPVTEPEPDAEHGNSPQVEESKAEVDEEAPYDSDVFMDTTPVSETVDLGVLGEHDVKNENIELEESKHLDTQEQNYVLPSETTNFADITIEQTKIKLTNCEEESIEPQNTKTVPGLLHVTNPETKGDSFEMEEINTNAEDEAGIATLSRARSDSSGFLDGDSEIYSMRMLTNGNGSDMQIESSQQDVSNSDMVNVDSLISENVNSDIMLGSSPNENDLSSTSLVLDSEVTFSAINDRSLPNNLLQELSSVKDWMQSNSYTKFTDRSVSDEEACAIAEEGKEVDNNLLLELSESKPLEKQNYNTSVNSSKKASVESAISPLVRSSLSLYQESFSGRTLPGYPMSVQHLTVSVDNKELVRQRTMSLRGIEGTSSVSMGNVRRVKSAPNCLEHLTSRDDLVRGSSWSSYSNMFSFCSDESVIHVGLQRANTSRGSDKRLSDVNDGTLKLEASLEVDGVVSDQEHKATSNSDPPTSTRYLKPNAFPYGRGAKRSASDPSAVSGRSVKDLRELVGELADRGWEITMGTDSSSFACHSEQQLLRLQGDAVRAGLAAYGRQLVGGQADVQNGGHEVAEACKEMQAVREVRDRIAAELRRVADLLEEQPPHRVADITGQMAVLLREQTRLCRQLEALSCDSSPSIFVEPAPCCSVLEAVREENRRLQSLVERNSLELAEIRKLLKELVAVKKS